MDGTKEDLIKYLMDTSKKTIPVRDHSMILVHKSTWTIHVQPESYYYNEPDFYDKYIVIKSQLPFMCKCERVADIDKYPGLYCDRFLTNFSNYDYIRKVQSVLLPPSTKLSLLERAWIAFSVVVLCDKNYVSIPEWTKDSELIQKVADNPLKRRREDCDERALFYNIYGKEIDVIRI